MHLAEIPPPTPPFRVSLSGQMTEDNIEIGLCNESGFKRLSPAEVKDYLAAIA